MNARQIAKANALLGASEYAATRTSDFTHDPLTKVDMKFASALAMINTAIEQLGGKQSIQSGRSFLQESAEQAILRDELEDYLSDLNFTVATIAEEIGNPAIKTRFRTADSRGDDQLAATALGMAAAIEELSLNDELESHGYPADTAAHLKALVKEFKSTEAGQGRSRGNQVGVHRRHSRRRSQRRNRHQDHHLHLPSGLQGQRRGAHCLGNRQSCPAGAESGGCDSGACESLTHPIRSADLTPPPFDRTAGCLNGGPLFLFCWGGRLCRLFSFYRSSRMLPTPPHPEPIVAEFTFGQLIPRLAIRGFLH